MHKTRPNIFVIGAGRNGTSLTAGLFHSEIYFQGDSLHAPSPENPKGYFEDAFVNRLNNRILSRYSPEPEKIGGHLYRADAMGARNGWLVRLPLDVVPAALPEEEAQITKLVSKQPFCLKDTRFCYLLHLWRDLAPGPVRMVCVFRRPEVAAASVLRSLRTRAGLFDVAMSVSQCLELWTLMYRHVLERHALSGDWLFLRYEDILSGRVIPALAEFTEFPIDQSFPDVSLNRSQAEFSASPEAERIYEQLCSKAV